MLVIKSVSKRSKDYIFFGDFSKYISSYQTATSKHVGLYSLRSPEYHTTFAGLNISHLPSHHYLLLTHPCQLIYIHMMPEHLEAGILFHQEQNQLSGRSRGIKIISHSPVYGIENCCKYHNNYVWLTIVSVNCRYSQPQSSVAPPGTENAAGKRDLSRTTAIHKKFSCQVNTNLIDVLRIFFNIQGDFQSLRVQDHEEFNLSKSAYKQEKEFKGVQLMNSCLDCQSETVTVLEVDMWFRKKLLLG